MRRVRVPSPLSCTPADQCHSAPGGTDSLVPPQLGTDADAGNQQRGGPGGVVTPTATVTTTYDPASVIPGPTATQSGIASNCNNYAEAKTGDDCYDFAVAHNITTDQLYSWNMILGPGGANCSLQFQAEEYYCVGTASSVTASPTTTSTSRTGSVAIPSPTQSGIDASCNTYAKAQTGDDCYDFAMAHSITPAQLYQWNAVLGTNGANCSTQFQAGENYCVGVSSAASTTSKPSSTSSVTAPGPTQSGIASNCNQFVKAVSGDDCYDFVVANSITPDQLYQWNTVLGASGANCNLQFQAGEYYCVGVSS